jgi:hypothetical protein
VLELLNMSHVLTGLNPFQTSTGCFFNNKQKKKDIPLSQFIQKSWDKNLNFVDSLNATYQAIVGNHKSFAVFETDFKKQNNGTVETFKGALDFLILPLIARRLWNWSWLQMLNNNNSFSLQLVISAARVCAQIISLARILIGIALTICLTPIVGLICWFRPTDKPTIKSDSTSQEPLESLQNETRPIDCCSIGARI